MLQSDNTPTVLLFKRLILLLVLSSCCLLPAVSIISMHLWSFIEILPFVFYISLEIIVFCYNYSERNLFSNILKKQYLGNRDLLGGWDELKAPPGSSFIGKGILYTLLGVCVICPLIYTNHLFAYCNGISEMAVDASAIQCSGGYMGAQLVSVIIAFRVMHLELVHSNRIDNFYMIYEAVDTQLEIIERVKAAFVRNGLNALVISSKICGALSLIVCCIWVFKTIVSQTDPVDSNELFTDDCVNIAMLFVYCNQRLAEYFLMDLTLYCVWLRISAQCFCFLWVYGVINSLFHIIMYAPINLSKAVEQHTSSAPTIPTTTMSIMSSIIANGIPFEKEDIVQVQANATAITENNCITAIPSVIATSTTNPSVAPMMIESSTGAPGTPSAKQTKRPFSPIRSPINLSSIYGTSTRHTHITTHTNHSQSIADLYIALGKLLHMRLLKKSIDTIAMPKPPAARYQSIIEGGSIGVVLLHKMLDFQNRDSLSDHGQGKTGTDRNCSRLQFPYSDFLLNQILNYQCNSSKSILLFLTIQYCRESIFYLKKSEDKQNDKLEQLKSNGKQCRAVLYNNTSQLLMLVLSMIFHIDVLSSHIHAITLFCDAAKCDEYKEIEVAKRKARDLELELEKNQKIYQQKSGNVEYVFPETKKKEGGNMVPIPIAGDHAVLSNIEIPARVSNVPISGADNGTKPAQVVSVRVTETMSSTDVTSPPNPTTVIDGVESLISAAVNTESGLKACSYDVYQCVDYFLLFCFGPLKSVALPRCCSHNSKSIRFHKEQKQVSNVSDAGLTDKLSKPKPTTNSSTTSNVAGKVTKSTNTSYKNETMIGSTTNLLYSNTCLATTNCYLTMVSQCIEILGSICEHSLQEDRKFNQTIHCMPAILKCLLQLDCSINQYVHVYSEHYYTHCKNMTSHFKNHMSGSMKLLRNRALVQLPELNMMLTTISDTICLISDIYHDVLFRNNCDCKYRNCFTTTEWEKLMSYKRKN